ncbi:MAG: Acyl-CoA dehydrogenase family er 11 [Ilumatobacteraceae bacterium]|nr:Acyl-CoA dehydrogenase family er 11 [Ilumatobacteraceae bacterium]
MASARDVDAQQVRADFERWLGSRHAGAAITDMQLPGTGASNGTYLCTVDIGNQQTRELVLRLQPGENQFLDPDVIFQSAVMEALEANSHLPVPHVVWKEPDPTPLGAPFFVMDRIDGRVLSDSHHDSGWALDLSPEQRARMYESTVGAFATLHGIPVDSNFHFLRRPGHGSALQRHMQWMQRWHSWAARGRSLEIIDDGLQYVLETCPVDESEHIIWGDGRPGNMIFADDLSVAAVVDWELAATGPAGIDLGWWLMFEESQTTARGIQRPSGVPDEASIVQRYESLTGSTVRDLEFYKVLAKLQFAIIVLRYVDMQVAAGKMAADTTMGTRSPITRMLADAIGLEPPEASPDYEAAVRPKDAATPSASP